MTPESAEKKAIKDYLYLINAFSYWNMAGMGSYPGLADITCIHNGKVYQIEVKAKGGRQSHHQRIFQNAWEEAGGIYILGGLDEVMEVIKR